MTKPALEAQSLTVRRGSRTILSGLNLAFSVGVTAILGPNGAGKTTLLDSLATLGARDRGSVALNGVVATSRAARRAHYARIGFMPQDWRFFTGFTAAETVRYAAWLKGADSRVAVVAASKALESVGLASVAGSPVRRLSGGMRQRVGLAESIVMDPDVVILDEPTVGLDPQQRREFRETLRLRGATASLILSTHLTDDVRALADRVIVLADGEVRFDGSVDELQGLGGAGDDHDLPLERGYLAALHRNAAA